MDSQRSSLPLAGKVAIVTGASRGIGRAVAQRLSRDGAAVVINYTQNAAKANELVAELTAQGGQALAVQADLGIVADIRQLFEQAKQHFGHLDILVNNAGTAGGSPLDAITEEHFDSIFNVNVRGTVFAAQEAARQFGPEGGRIINLSSVLGNRPSPGTAIYAATKAAIDSITKTLAAELGPRGIRVNAVAPALTVTDMGTHTPAAFQEYTAAHTALGRMGQPEEIADVVAFLAGHDGRWVSGQTIYADGGYHG